MFMTGNACICEPNIYVYIICLLINMFIPFLILYQLSPSSTGNKYFLQRNSLTVAIKMRGVSYSDDKWMNSYDKMSFSYHSRYSMENYANIIIKNCVKKPPLIDINKGLSNIFLTRGQRF